MGFPLLDVLFDCATVHRIALHTYAYKQYWKPYFYIY